MSALSSPKAASALSSPKAASSITLHAPPKLAPNNLSGNGLLLVYSAGATCWTIPDKFPRGDAATPSAIGVEDLMANEDIIAANLIPGPGAWLLVVRTGKYVRVFRGPNQLIFSMAVDSVPTLASKSAENSLRYRDRIGLASGICTVLCGDQSQLICIGCNDGGILCLASESRGDDEFSFKMNFKLENRGYHTSPVVSLSSEYHDRRGAETPPGCFELASLDQSGRLILWNAPEDSQPMITRSSYSFQEAACSVRCRKGEVFVGLSSGEIHCYDVVRGSVSWSIVAHSRFLSAMDIHPTRDVLASAAEDGSVAVWQLQQGDEGIDVLFSNVWDDVMVCGVAFCGAGCDYIGVCGYDTDQLKMLKWN